MITDTHNLRLRFQGGRQDGRMINDKVWSLHKALLYSYQKGTAVLADGREFLALFNPNKLTPDYDTKMLSIPYKEVRLNGEIVGKSFEGMEPTDVKPGDVLRWKETNTHWLVYLQYLEEIAYFRADIRRCDQVVFVNEKPYWVYIRGPVETTIQDNMKAGTSWNDLNYSLVMYITRNEETDNYFHRFQKIKVGNIENKWEDGFHYKTWRVTDVNPYYGDGIIEVFLQEDFENSIADARRDEIIEEQLLNPPVEPVLGEPIISGADEVEIYSLANYTLENVEEPGTWSVNSTKVKIKSIQDNSITLEVTTGRSGEFTLSYTYGENILEKKILIKSF